MSTTLGKRIQAKRATLQVRNENKNLRENIGELIEAMQALRSLAFNVKFKKGGITIDSPGGPLIGGGNFPDYSGL